MIFGTQRSLADIIGPEPELTWRIDMPETLDAGGAGLGVHDADTAELNKWDVCYSALKENQELREAITAIKAELEALHRSNQLRALVAAGTFILGFLLCSILGAVAVWR